MHVLPILNVKFPSLFNLKHSNFVKTIKENKTTPWLEKEVFCYFELIMSSYL